MDHADAICTCMMDLGFMEDERNNFMPTFAAYYDAAAAKVSIKKCSFTVKGMTEVSKKEDRDDTEKLSLDGKAKPDHTVSTLTGGCCMKLVLTRAMLERSRRTAAETPLLRIRSWSGSQDASAPDKVRPPGFQAARRCHHGSFGVCVAGGTGQQLCCKLDACVSVFLHGGVGKVVVPPMIIITIITITITTVITIIVIINSKKKKNTNNSNGNYNNYVFNSSVRLP